MQVIELTEREQRILNEAKYITSNCTTVRDTARAFKMGKSTIHRDMSKKLKELDPQLYKDVCFVLSCNLDERHLRGGEATRLKYNDSYNRN